MKQWQATENIYTNNDSGRRGGNARLIVVHTTEGGDNVRDVAIWQQSKSAGGSYHVLIARDGTSVRSNDDAFIPWAAMRSGNLAGYHVSLGGKAKFTRDEWLARPEQLATLADYIRHTARLASIPLVKVGPDVVRRADGRGICGHDDISKAWKETDHWDPGPGFPWDHVLKLAGASGSGPAPSVHVVQPGDTLAAIARKYGTTWQALAHMNTSALVDPDRIRPGLVIKLKP